MDTGRTTNTRISRRRLLAGAAGLGASMLGLEGFVLEPRRLAVTHHRIGEPLSEGHRPLRLAVLTDLHLRSIGELEDDAAERVESLDPDVILIIGDSVDRPDSLPLLHAFLGLLPAATPKYATLGNWEYWSGIDPIAISATFERFSGRLLVNESALITHEGANACLVGLDDLVGGTPDLQRAWLQDETDADALLLSHCPAYRDRITAGEGERFAAMLSGHTHGGQVALGQLAPVRPHGSGRYVSGWYRDGTIDLYVSRGIGTTLLPIRLGSVPEIALFEWFLKSI